MEKEPPNNLRELAHRVRVAFQDRPLESVGWLLLALFVFGLTGPGQLALMGLLGFAAFSGLVALVAAVLRKLRPE